MDPSQGENRANFGEFNKSSETVTNGYNRNKKDENQAEGGVAGGDKKS